MVNRRRGYLARTGNEPSFRLLKIHAHLAAGSQLFIKFLGFSKIPYMPRKIVAHMLYAIEN
jgi:hypothetical protein